MNLGSILRLCLDCTWMHWLNPCSQSTAQRRGDQLSRSLRVARAIPPHGHRQGKRRNAGSLSPYGSFYQQAMGMSMLSIRS